MNELRTGAAVGILVLGAAGLVGCGGDDSAAEATRATVGRSAAAARDLSQGGTCRPGEAITGCCTVKSGYDTTKAPLAAFAAKTEGDWSRNFPAYAGAIGRCVSESGVAVREIAKAWSVDGSFVAVRMIANDGKAWNCAVDTTSKTRPQSTSVAVTEPPLAGAGAPVFYPARDTPPLVTCGRLERIAGPRGRTEGWLHYDRC